MTERNGKERGEALAPSYHIHHDQGGPVTDLLEPLLMASLNLAAFHSTKQAVSNRKNVVAFSRLPLALASLALQTGRLEGGTINVYLK